MSDLEGVREWESPFESNGARERIEQDEDEVGEVKLDSHLTREGEGGRGGRESRLL